MLKVSRVLNSPLRVNAMKCFSSYAPPSMDFLTYNFGDVKLQVRSCCHCCFYCCCLLYYVHVCHSVARQSLMLKWLTRLMALWMLIIGTDKALNPDKYFIIVPCALGNGQSSSPSNTPEPYDRARFPNVTLYDNVTLQHRLITELFGISKVKLVTGWSMGAQQTFQWGEDFSLCWLCQDSSS